VPWRKFPNHFGARCQNRWSSGDAGSRHIDYRISMYQPMAHVARHSISCRTDLSLLEGEADGNRGKNHVVRKHDYSSSSAGPSNTRSRIAGWSIWCFW